MRKSLGTPAKIAALALVVGLAGGCATTDQLSNVQSTAQSAQSAAQGAKSTANQANQKANEALQQSDRKSTRLNSSHTDISRMPSSA